jgi:hypothetical protein
VEESTPICIYGKVHSDCGSQCEPTCIYSTPICIKVCISGCFCPKDRPIFDQIGRKCVKLEECPPTTATATAATTVKQEVDAALFVDLRAGSRGKAKARARTGAAGTGKGTDSDTFYTKDIFDLALGGDVSTIKHATANTGRFRNALPAIIFGNWLMPANMTSKFWRVSKEMEWLIHPQYYEYAHAKSGLLRQYVKHEMQNPDFNEFPVGRLLNMYHQQQQAISKGTATTTDTGDTAGAGTALSLFSRPVVVMGAFNENWGWLSSYYTNRTVCWGLRYHRHHHPVSSMYNEDELQPLLNDPNVVAILTNGHLNITHDKILSLPLGISVLSDPEIFNSIRRNYGLPFTERVEIFPAHPQESYWIDQINNNTKGNGILRKNKVLFWGGSSYGIRNTLVECIAGGLLKERNHSLKDTYISVKHLRDGIYWDLLRTHNNEQDDETATVTIQQPILSTMPPGSRIRRKDLYEVMISSRMILCLAGMGWDTYRLWESLLLGSVPVVERGFGMERTFRGLPVLFVDDFSLLTPLLLRQAYAQALYIAEEGTRSPSKGWNYHRVSVRYWKNLLSEIISEGKGLSAVSGEDKHPINPDDKQFARPLVPFACIPPPPPTQAVDSTTSSSSKQRQEQEQGHGQGERGWCGVGTKRTLHHSCGVRQGPFKLGFLENVDRRDAQGVAYG